MENTYEGYKNHLQKIAHLNSAIALLSWDQEIYMPEKGSSVRAQQFSTLSTLVHEMSTDTDFENLVNHLLAKSSFGFKETRNLEETKESIEQNKKLSSAFIQKSAITRSEAFQAWEKARRKEDYQFFVPSLKKIIDLEREKTEYLGYENHPYDSLLNLYEKKLTVTSLEKIFKEVKNQIVPLIKQIRNTSQVDDSFLYQSFDKDKQFDFSIEILKFMGYDFKAGRQDISTHPFTINFNAQDVRVTTRINENDLSEVIWSTIHEGGHGLYEQGLLVNHYGLPSGEFVSLGIHESQSRIWENNLGRGKYWWQFIYPKLQSVFPKQLSSVSLDDFYKAINKVEPSLIRTSSDELTYHVHVMIRYEIEKSLLEGQIEVEDLEEVWNQKYLDYLGVTPTKPTEGVLQDIHWSHGSLGYFPTYSLGSFYAAQFYAQAKKDIDNLENQLKNGEVGEFSRLMKKKIHQHGKLYGADQLCEKFTGEALNIKHFITYAKDKYGAIYNFSPI
jgi:carboxypeptidase Taq